MHLVVAGVAGTIFAVADDVDDSLRPGQHRPRPGPKPQTQTTIEDPVIDRRRIVLGLGFGVAAAAGLRHVPNGPEQSAQVSTSAGTSATSTNADSNGELVDAQPGVSTDAPTTTSEIAPFEAPVFDASVRLPAGGVAELVLTGGRIIDPDSGLDQVGNVAISEGLIVEISHEPIQAVKTIDVSSRVVSPGFIDILSYSPNGYGEWWKIADGVTANIGMHGLRFGASNFHDRWITEGSPVHFGGAVHNSHIRDDLGFDIYSSADGADISSITDAIESELRAGYLGIHAQPEYAPGISSLEMVDMGHLAARLGVPLCVHARYSDNLAPGLQTEATAEIISVARQTGAHMHVEHLNSTGGTGRMAEALDEIDQARAEGLSITSCMYPYEFWATTLQSARFQDWQQKFGIDYDDLQVAGTAETLTAETFQAAYDENKLTAAFAIPAGDIELGMQSPFMIIGSDAILETSHNNHPRSTGCFARVLGRYVRNRQLVALSDALAMMTIRPANLLGLSSPAMRRKGRLQIGADADITVFDPATVSDRSTIADPAQESVGIDYVFVNGTAVRSGGVTDRTVLPGQAMTSSIA